jgi:hypothetical protein
MTPNEVVLAAALVPAHDGCYQYRTNRTNMIIKLEVAHRRRELGDNVTTEICVLTHRQDPERLRHAIDGAYVCLGCQSRLERDLIDLPALDVDLIRAHSLTGPAKDRVKGGDVEARMPIRADITELRDNLNRTLASWCSVVIEDRGFTSPDQTVPAMTSFLLANLAWLVKQAFIDDYDSEIRTLRAQAFNKAFPSGRRQFPVGSCIEDDCIGTLVAVLNDVDTLLPNSVTCDYDPTHTWSSMQWRMLGNRIHQISA